MIAPKRVLIDECVSRRVLDAVNGILAMGRQEQVQFIYLTDFVGSCGAKDIEWVPKARAAGYMVVSADMGRRKRGDKLPELCDLYGVKHVLISPKLKQKGQMAIAMALFACWQGIGIAWGEANSSRFQLQLVSILGKHEVGTHRPALHRHPARRQRVLFPPGGPA